MSFVLIVYRCYLNPATNFIWAFIVPVILIILANIGFFIIAATIMWKHQMRNREKSKVDNVCRWMKSAISLVVVMSLTWIFGILIIVVDQLAAVAYIYTIMVSFQGLFIFIIFILMSQAVRDTYKKCWKTHTCLSPRVTTKSNGVVSWWNYSPQHNIPI